MTCDGEVPKTIPVDLSCLTARRPVINLSMIDLPPGLRPTKRTAQKVDSEYVVCVLKAGRADK